MLTMTLANIADLHALEAIDQECGRYFAFDPQSEMNHSWSLEECLMTGDIPPGIAKEDFKRQNYSLCCIRQDDVLIGFLAYYLGYHKKDTAYLSVLYIQEANRKSGIGSAIVDMLTRKLAIEQYRTFRLHCSLRNATALRFWVKNGFDHIVDVECNGNLFPENFGGIELVKEISSFV